MKPLITSLAALMLFLAGHVRAVEFSTAEITGKRVTICRVNLREEKLLLFHRDETGQPFKRFETLSKWLDARGKQLTFAMNGGMYHGDFSAVGLSISGGKQLTPLNLADGQGNFFLKPNGVFLISEAGARIVESSEFPGLRGQVMLATQSGPLLLHRGKIHPAFKQGSKNVLLRNGVGVPSPDVAIFAISEDPVNFYDFASLFRDVLHCPDALFLDGTVSSLHSTQLQRSDFRMDLGPILGVVK